MLLSSPQTIVSAAALLTSPLIARPLLLSRERSHMAEWKKVKDGVLVLEGTIMSIVYRHSPSGSFQIYQGDRHLWPCMTLDAAKHDAKRILADLIEIGAQPQS